MRAKLILIVVVFFISGIQNLYAQLPNCAGIDSTYVFAHQGNNIMAYDPAQPLSATNPWVYLAGMGGGGGLAIAHNLNGGTPSPAFYTSISGNFHYHDGTMWVNTGHAAQAVNPGGGINYIFNKNGGNGQIFRYDGTAAATLITTVAPGSGPYDLAVDAQDNFYHLYTSTSPGWVIRYDPNGVALDSVIVTGNPIQNAGGGFAMIGNTVFAVFNTNPSLYSGVIVGNTVNLTPIGNMAASDLATCPSMANFTPPVPPEAAFIMSHDTICTGECITLTDTSMNNPTSWTWTIPGGSPASSILPSPGTVCFNTAGVYTIQLVVSNIAGADTATKILVVNQTPSASISGDTVLCRGESTTLDASPAGMSYLWTTSSTAQSITLFPQSSQSYSVVVTDNGCSDTAAIFVHVDILDPLQITGDTVLCIGESTTLSVMPNTASQYMWSNSMNTPQITVTPNVTTRYTVIVMEGVCVDTASVEVGVYPYPFINMTPTLTNCDIPNGTISVQVNSGSPAFTYQWSNGSTDSVATGLGVGQYNVTVLDSKGCSASGSAEVLMHPKPILTVSPDTVYIKLGETVQLFATGTDYYYWNPNRNLDCFDCPNPLATPEKDVVYCVEGTTVFGCKDTQCVVVNVEPVCDDYFVPSAFSPNGDGLNDFFFVKGRCVVFYDMLIVNRWGQVVFSSNNSDSKWDGTFKGVPQSSDVYFYVTNVQLLDGKRITLKGDLTLMR